MDRTRIIADCKRLVIKVGSAVLTDKNGVSRRRIHRLASQLADIIAGGRQVVLVTSGAVASGRAKIKSLQLGQTLSMPQKQAAAALGQAGLMQIYEDALDVHGILAAQILLTAQDLRSRERYRNISNTLNTLLEWNVLPIINENDTVAVQEIKLGDNDNLAAQLTNLLGAEMMINLTNVDGLLTADPRVDPDAKLVPVVERVEAGHLNSASQVAGQLGTGGILSKIKAADKVAMCGAYTIIANGQKEGILNRIMLGKAEGTLFMPYPKHYSRRQHWLAFASGQQGEIIIDQGAVSALIDNHKSLLAAGVREIKGVFQAGDALKIFSPQGSLVGVGLSNYGSQELGLIKGLRSNQIAQTLGRADVPEVIHRDNLVILANE